jgi:hypothetical protein
VFKKMTLENMLFARLQQLAKFKTLLKYQIHLN